MSAYDFLKGLGEKIPQKVLRQEYNRQRQALLSSINRLKKKGIDTSSFKVPARPKKITEGSIRNIEKTRAKWNYELKHSGSSPIRRANIEYKHKQAMRRALEKLLENDKKQARQNITQPSPQAQAWAEAGIPDYDDTLVHNLEMIIEDALMETAGGGQSAKSGKQSAYYAMVNHRAEIAMQRFIDIGTGEPELRKLYSWNIRDDYMNIQDTLESWIWYQSDGTYDFPNMAGLNMVITAMTTTKKTPEWLKREMANMDDEEDIADFI